MGLLLRVPTSRAAPVVDVMSTPRVRDAPSAIGPVSAVQISRYLTVKTGQTRHSLAEPVDFIQVWLAPCWNLQRA